MERVLRSSGKGCELDGGCNAAYRAGMSHALEDPTGEQLDPTEAGKAWELAIEYLKQIQEYEQARRSTSGIGSVVGGAHQEG